MSTVAENVFLRPNFLLLLTKNHKKTLGNSENSVNILNLKKVFIFRLITIRSETKFGQPVNYSNLDLGRFKKKQRQFYQTE